VSAPPIPIAIVLTSFDPGGTERQMIELIARLDRRRFTVHVACFRREGQWRSKVERAAASVTAFPLRSFAAPSTFTRLGDFAGWCRRHRIAVVQACDFYANVFALAGATLARVPVRIGSRRDILLPRRTAGQHRLQRYAYRLAHRVVANSQAAASQVAAEGISAGRIAVIPNGVDLQQYVPRFVRRPRRIITTVANLRGEKGHEVLIDAAAIACRRHPDLRFQLVGDGPMRAAHERQVREYGLSDNVLFLGHRDDVPALLASSDLFVLPSRTEAFPNGLVEAMAAALPSVASDVGGIPELIQHGRNGLLVAPGDAPALAQALNALVEDDDRATGLGAAARATIEARYSFDRMVTSFEELYLHELAGSTFPIHALCAR
jgi:glycosyltransferase involved in cell wall biosynthesis